MTIPLPGGRSLVLAGSDRAILWLLAGGLALALVLVLYRQERRLVSRPAGLGLIGLRIAAIVALVVALFEPIAARTVRDEVRGRVVVAVDASASMDQPDPNRDGDRAQNLARVLNLSAGESLADLPRREVARRLVAGDTAVVGRLARTHDLAATTFARGPLASGPLPAVADALRAAPTPDAPDRLGTDPGAALAPALNADDTAPVVAAVILGDGRFNAGPPVAELAGRMQARGVPVFPVLIGTSDRPRDVAIAAVRAPDRVQKGDTGSVVVTLKADGVAPGTELGVTLSRPGIAPMRQVARVGAEGARPTATFAVPFEASGVVPLTLEADRATPDDARADNNRRVVAVQVADDPTRILLVESDPRWEGRYLRDALTRDPRLKVDRIVFHPPTNPDTPPTDPDRWPDPPTDPQAPDPLSRYDLIVVGDVAPGDLGPDVAARLDRFVANRGGTLAILEGPRSRGMSLPAALVPVVDPAPPAGPTTPGSEILPAGWRLAPDPAARADRDRWPMLALGDTPEADPAAWAALPPLPWVVAGRTKPAATALLTVGEAAAVAAQPYGLGKVLWVGTDGTWRWRFRVGDAVHGRFWGQVVRWAGPGGLAVGNRAVRFGPERPRVRSGEPIPVRARLADDVPDLPTSPLLVARVVPRDAPPGADAVALATFRPTPGAAGMFVAEVPALPPGLYDVRLDAPDLARFGAIPAAPLDVVAAETGETVELATDPAAFEILAARTGGKMLHDHEADALADLIRQKARAVSRTVETPLWDTPAALILFVALLSAEWVLRKKVGLP